MKLDGSLSKFKEPLVFARQEVLKYVAEFIVCDDQVGK